MVMKEPEVSNVSRNNTSIAVWKSTKDKLDKNRAPGQCYNGFISQLVDMWEKIGEDKTPSGKAPAIDKVKA